jgi:hypothetical protein
VKAYLDPQKKKKDQKQRRLEQKNALAEPKLKEKKNKSSEKNTLPEQKCRQLQQDAQKQEQKDTHLAEIFGAQLGLVKRTACACPDGRSLVENAKRLVEATEGPPKTTILDLLEKPFQAQLEKGVGSFLDRNTDCSLQLPPVAGKHLKAPRPGEAAAGGHNPGRPRRTQEYFGAASRWLKALVLRERIEEGTRPPGKAEPRSSQGGEGDPRICACPGSRRPATDSKPLSFRSTYPSSPKGNAATAKENSVPRHGRWAITEAHSLKAPSLNNRNFPGVNDAEGLIA